MRYLLFLVAIACPTSLAESTIAAEKLHPSSPVADSASQLLVVRSKAWWASSGTLRRYERERGGVWKSVGASISVELGRNGMAWGRGLHVTPEKGPIKREGDHRSPAGVYELDAAFGAAAELPAESHGFPYAQMHATSYCVEDQRSEHYNQLIDSTVVGPTAWERWSEMARPDGLFDWGVVVRQNSPDPERGAGSCIFLHIRRGAKRPTAGCTAMPKEGLIEILRWLDSKRHPLLVQLPDEAFKMTQLSWGLPNE